MIIVLFLHRFCFSMRTRILPYRSHFDGYTYPYRTVEPDPQLTEHMEISYQRARGVNMQDEGANAWEKSGSL